MVRTPWPVFSLSMLQSDIIGALFVLGFLRYGLPPGDRIQLQDLPRLNLVIFVLSAHVVFFAGVAANFKLLVPVFRWQRRDNLLAEADPAATELARRRVLRMPFYRTVVSLVVWAIGSAVFIVASWSVARYAAPVVAVATALGPPRPRSSATCSPSGSCGPSRWPRCAAACRKTCGHPASSCA
ncbi:putative transmembrane protein [Mycobacterium kansasii]|uniref:Putative transmembrane protein n=1 Tax=Mycobacterium kansasii TaxID=1768 RepID=A0A1V3XBB3_MYCKA|nr:putative transmembrane protein [Mycobacterium kansasii]